MKRIVNTTATADIGYIEKLPFRAPSAEVESAVGGRVTQIIEQLKADPTADIHPLRSDIDNFIFDLFEIRTARETVRRFYETVGRAEESGEAVEEVAAQAAAV